MKNNLSKWILAIAVVMAVAMPAKVLASGACTCARFNDWKDRGCNPNYGGAGMPQSAPSCSGDCGMPQWWVNEPYLNLWISDTPLSYTMSSGKTLDFRFFYRQRYQLPSPDQVPSLYSINGQTCPARCWDTYFDDTCANVNNSMTNASWSHNWMMSVVYWDTHYDANHASGYTNFSTGYEAIVFYPEGSSTYFYKTSTSSQLQDPSTQDTLVPQSGTSFPTPIQSGSTQTADANGIYWGDSTNGFRLVHPDGSVDVLSFWSASRTTDSTGLFVDACRSFLTKKIG